MNPSFRPASALFIAALAMFAAIRSSSSAATPDVVSAILIDGDIHQNWPDYGVVAFHRQNSTGPLPVNFSIGGTAVAGVDYTAPAGNTITIPDGDREAWLEFAPTGQPLAADKTIVVTLQAGTDYTVSTVKSEMAATLILAKSSPLPGLKESVRFLLQAGFGANADLKNVTEVSKKGFDKWLTEQFAKPVGLQQPYLDRLDRAARAKKNQINSDDKILPWWKQAMNTSSSADPLRQRVAFALSEIMVISDDLDDLGNQPIGMVNYYDMLLKGSFGNFRTLLYNVGLHPAMGTYLNHLGNEKGNGDPLNPTFADENFAREIMQLFSIGLFDLNLDGTQKLVDGKPVQTYDNAVIADMAKVMTGFGFGGHKKDDSFHYAQEAFTVPMRMWDEFHDLTAKKLLKDKNGVVSTLPARTLTNDPTSGALAMLDYNFVIDMLFNHPNCAPFISKQLIQKLVTSNPSPAYVQRVATVFENNGSGVRGDLQAVIRRILMDPEARNASFIASSSSGKMKEPYLRTVNLLRGLNAKAPNGVFDMRYLEEVHFQQPLSAPSVFNFFKPGYAPAGPVNDANLVAPEFQILNAVTATAVPNYYFDALNYRGFSDAAQKRAQEVRPALTAELALAGDVPALMRRLDLILTGATLPKEQHQVIREAVQAITRDLTDDWKRERVNMAIYLISTSPEFGILK
ncbi:MAG: DUF1800 family protein [Chthoniobacteraceae bacterium]